MKKDTRKNVVIKSKQSAVTKSNEMVSITYCLQYNKGQSDDMLESSAGFLKRFKMSFYTHEN